MAHQILNIDEQLTKQAYDIINRDGNDISLSFSRYFDTVHSWYPIISKALLYERFTHLRRSPKADFSVLIITIHLISQTYQPTPVQRYDLEQLYHTTKGLYSIAMSTGISSIELIQAGILLALYEHTQALHSATYQTLGACARMGYMLGLHESLSQNTPLDAEANSAAEKRRQVWWGIIILERYV